MKDFILASNRAFSLLVILWAMYCSYQTYIDAVAIYSSSHDKAAVNFIGDCIESGKSVDYVDGLMFSQLACVDNNGVRSMFSFESELSVASVSQLLLRKLMFNVSFLGS